MPNKPTSAKESVRILFRAVLLILLFSGAIVPIYGQDRVEWSAVDGADHYRVEIRQAGELILDTRSDDTWLPLFLPAGEYEFRVNVINTFGRVANSSDWKVLLIKAPVIPFIISLEPSSIYEGADTVFIARVSGFIPESETSAGTMFHIESESEKPIDLDISGYSGAVEVDGETAAWGEVSLNSGRKDPTVGPWTLVMTNPDGKSSSMASSLTVLDNLKPRIRSVKPDEFHIGEPHNPLEIKVTGMEDGAELTFEGPAPLQPILLGRSEDGILEYSLNLRDSTPGVYSITVTNPSGGTDTREKALELLPAELTEEEIAAQNALKIDEKEPLPLAEYPRSLFFGWSISFPLGATSDFYTADYVGFTLGYSQNFHNDFFRKLYWLKGLSWDFSYNYTYHHTSYPIADIRLNRHSFLLGLNYVTPFNFPLNLLLRVSSGLGMSYYTSPDESDRDADLGGFTLSDLGSMDYVMRFGGGMRIDVSKRWYIDLLCDVTATFYLSRTAWTLLPRIEGGWRL